MYSLFHFSQGNFILMFVIIDNYLPMLSCIPLGHKEFLVFFTLYCIPTI